MTRGRTIKDIPVGLYHLSYYLPDRVATVEELAEMLSFDPEKLRMFKEVHGLRAVRVADGETTADIAVKVAAKALDESGIDGREIDVLIFYHTIYMVSLHPVCLVGRIQHELGLSRSIGFSVWEQNCASIITAIRIAKDMILAGSAETVMLVGADADVGATREIPGTTLLGEGGSAIIVRANCTENKIVGTMTQTDASLYKGYCSTEEEFARFNMIYVLATSRIMRRALKEMGLALDQIRLIIPHNINISSWNRILAMLKCDSKILFADNIASNGHIFGSDLVINFVDAVSAGRLERGDRALLVTAGLGACWGCAVIEH